MFFALSFNRLSTEPSVLYCRKPITMAREKQHSEIDSVGVGAMTSVMTVIICNIIYSLHLGLRNCIY